MSQRQNVPGETYLEHRTASNIVPEPVHWLWKNVIPDESVTMIAGHGGEGKSTVSMDFSARISCGRPWPDNLTETFDPGGVVILNVEDRPEKVTVPRLKAAEANLSRIEIITRKVTIDSDGQDIRRPIDIRTDIDRIAVVVDRTPGCKALIVDPITALIGDTDSNNVTQVRLAMLALSDLAEEKRIAVLVISHLSKGTDSTPALRTLGSIGFTAAARAAWFVVEHPADKNRRLFLLAKSNYGPKRDGLSFTVATTQEDVPYVLWDAEPATITLDDALGGKVREAPKLEEAERWLRGFLGDVPKPSSDVTDAAKREGYSWDTIKRAKKSLGIVSRKLGLSGGWSWELPSRTDAVSVRAAPSDNDTLLRYSEPPLPTDDQTLQRGASKTEGAAPKDTDPLRFSADPDERAAIQSVEAEEEIADRNGGRE